MPKVSLLTKEVILQAALKVVQEEGLYALSARNVAQQMGSSTRPIYESYANMDELKEDVLKEIRQVLIQSYQTYRRTGDALLDLLLGYVHTAHTKSILFRCYYSTDNPDNLLDKADMAQTLQANLEEVSLDKRQEIVNHISIYIYGLSGLIASKKVEYDENAMEIHLKEVFQTILHRNRGTD
jgi:AcrR family transcriptional regulator